MAEKLNLVENQNWKLSVDQAGTATLNTAETYLDRDIEVVVPQGAYTVKPEASYDENSAVVNPALTASIDTSEGSIVEAVGIKTNVADAGDKYFVIKPATNLDTTGTATVNVGGTIDITTAGYIAKDSNIPISGADVNVTGINVDVTNEDVYYMKINTLSDSQITGVSGIKTSNTDGAVHDTFEVTLQLPEGYYEAQTIKKDFSDIMPNIELNGAVDENILSGYKAYDDQGNVMIGSMVNYGDAAATMDKITSSTSITGSSVTFYAPTEEAPEGPSGIAINSTGSVDVTATINGTGYHEQNTSDTANFTTAQATKYITDINVGAGKTLNSVGNAGTISSINNQGTISELKGVGTISELNGSQTITSLNGTLTVVGSTDTDDDHTNASAGKIIFGADTIVQDGALVEATVGANAQGKIVVTKGWISADAELDGEIQTGDYSVSCAKVDPKISNSVSTGELAVSQTETDYAIEFTTVQTAAGTHTAKATVTTGWIDGGYKESTTEAINVDGVGAKSTVYLAKAVYSEALSTSKQTGTEVPEYYEVSNTAGYTEAGIAAQINVFDGSFDWA